MEPGAKIRAEDTIKTADVIDKTRKIFNMRKRFWFWGTPGGLVGAALFAIGVFELLYGLLKPNTSHILSGSIAMILGSLLLWVIFKKTRNIVYLQRKREVSSFWKRKKDDILLALISAVGGAIIGAFVPFSFTRII